jgi:hypothetical protein
MRRIALALVVLAVVAVAVYWFGLRGSSTPTAEAKPTEAVARIGEGRSAVLIGADGRLLGAVSSGTESSSTAPGRKPSSGKSAHEKQPEHLPVLPPKQPPKNGRQVGGHVLEQVHILAAAPKALRKYIGKTGYDKTGVEVQTTSGIEIRFGDDREAARKWEAAAAVLADPSVTLLSYVDVTAPSRPATGGQSHELAPLPGK